MKVAMPMGIALMYVSMLRMQFVEASHPTSTLAKAVQALAAWTTRGHSKLRGLPNVQSTYFGREEAGALASVPAIMACARGVAAEAVESASAVTVTLQAAGAPPDRDGSLDSCRARTQAPIPAGAQRPGRGYAQRRKIDAAEFPEEHGDTRK